MLPADSGEGEHGESPLPDHDGLLELVLSKLVLPADAYVQDGGLGVYLKASKAPRVRSEGQVVKVKPGGQHH